MVIREVDRGDEAALRRFWELGRLADDATRPFDFHVPWEGARATYTQGRAGFHNVLLAVHDPRGEMVGRAFVVLPDLDNTHLAFADVAVDPARWRHGFGSAALRAAEDHARRDGRRTMVLEAHAPFDAGGPGQAFAQAHGYTLAEWVDHVPDEHVVGYCRLNEAFNELQPLGDLDIEAEVWTEDRVRTRNEQARRGGRRELAVAALDPDGAMVGMSEVVLNEHAPHRGFQSGTLVLPEHRGRALGLLMKLRNHRRLRADFPDCVALMTGNAGVNAAMNAVSDRLGYRDVERCLELQKEL